MQEFYRQQPQSRAHLTQAEFSQEQSSGEQAQSYLNMSQQPMALRSSSMGLSSDSLVDVSLLVKKQKLNEHKRGKIISLNQINAVSNSNAHNRTQTLQFNGGPKSTVRRDSTGRRDDNSSPEATNMEPILIHESPPVTVDRRPFPTTSNRVSVISQSGSTVTVIKEMREIIHNNAIDRSYMADGQSREVILEN